MVGAMAKAAKEASEATELFIELFQDHKRNMMAVAKEHALTMQQVVALWNLSPGQGLAMNALADILMCDASNVTGIVDKLEARGLAKRGQAEDRRVKVLTLTDEGCALREALHVRMVAPPAWILRLSREDQRALRDILRRGIEGTLKRTEA